jgi:hypothetical protein
LVGLRLIIGASKFSQKGVDSFGTKEIKEEDEEEAWCSISASPHFEQYSPFCRFKDFHICLPAIFVDESKKEMNPLYQFSKAIYNFDEICRSSILCSQWIVADESMSAWWPWTTALGGLPNLSFVICKPEPLGKQKKSIIFYSTFEN